jgi:hypothetical protein
VLRASRLGLVAVALLSVAGCGGSLSPPDGAGGNAGTGTGDTGNGGITGSDGAIGPLDAQGDIATCLDEAPATPVAGMPCHYAIPVPPCDFEDRSHIEVRLGGVEIPRDTTHTNGWDYTDPTFTAVDIYGPSCDALTSGTLTTVTVVYRIILI